MTNHLPRVIALTALAWSAASFAQTPAAESEDTLAFNAGVVTDYRFRGITQSGLRPALQGGADFAHKSGFYVGAWGSTISWIRDAGVSKGSFELDLYGGYKGEITTGLAYDVGYLRYEYVGNKYKEIGVNASTDELYGALTYGPVTVKYSHAVSNLFGTPDSKNSGYLDVSANVDLGDGWAVVPHIGHQRVNNSSAFNYTDYSVTLTKDLGQGLLASAAVVGTDADKALYLNNRTAFTGKTGVVLGLKYSF